MYEHIIAKFAKKRILRGKYNKKNLLQQIERASREFYDLAQRLKEEKRQIESLTKNVEAKDERVLELKSLINSCSDTLRKMNLAGAKEVDIKDINDIAYSVGGRWMDYNDTEDTLKPYRKVRGNVDFSTLDRNDLDGWEVLQ